MSKYWTSKRTIKVLILAALLIVFYWGSRLTNLLNIPIFTDEAIYLRWGQIALGDARWRFISLIDGKQPLLIWLFLPALKLISDPLVAGRMVSVIAGFVSLVGLFLLGWYQSKSIRTGFIAATFYIIIPFFLVYDRLAIYDSLLCAISIWSLLGTVIFARRQDIGSALFLGTIIGAGLLTKSSANFFWYLLPLSLLIMRWRPKQLRQQFAYWVALVIMVIVQSQIYNSIMRLSEFRHIIGEKNLSFIYSFSEFFQNPFRVVFGNTTGLTSWLVGYFTWPIVIAVVFALAWKLKKNWREGLFYSGYFIIPFMALAFFGKVMYPRFLLFMVPPLILILSEFISFLSTKKKLVLFAPILLLGTLPAVYFDYKLLTDPINAPLIGADRQQLINDWPAGYGIAEVVEYVDKLSRQGKVIVGTEGTFGLFPMALELYLGKNSNVMFKAYWPVSEVPKELQQDAKTYPTFLLFKERQDIPKEWPLELINKYQRGDGPTYLLFYKVKPS